MTPSPRFVDPRPGGQAPLRLRVVRAAPGASLQDEGRRGHLHEGVPASGPLVPPLFAATRESLALGSDEAVLEVLLHPVSIEVESEGVLSLDGRPVFVRAGEVVTVTPGRHSAAYLGVPGGFDVPRVLGSRSTLPGAGVGGLEGRFLRAGDVLEARLPHAPAIRAAHEGTNGLPLDLAAPVPVVRGPDLFPDASWNALFSCVFRVGAAFDRVGIRLEGATLPPPASDRARSLPMRRGALQVTLDGHVVVLGPDHPTTGGYPVIGTIVESAFGLFAARRPGQEVRFREVVPERPAWLARD